MGVKIREKIKGSGVHWVFIDHNGNRTSKCVGSLKAAKEVAKKLEAMIVLEEFNVPEPDAVELPTLNVYSTTWLADQIKGVLDDATHERYGHVLARDIVPALGHLPIDQIEPRHIRDLLNKLRKAGRTSRSIALTRTVLSTCLNEAFVDGHIKSNPVKTLARTHKRSSVTEARRAKVHKVDPLTTDEVARFIDFGMAADSMIYGPMFLTGFRTGMRLGELIALHWDDIDWDAGVIRVRRSYKRGVIKPVKNGEERAVDMSSQLQAVLADLLKMRKIAAAKSGGWQISHIVFDLQGNYRAQNTVRKAFKAYLKKAGLRAIRVHDMRHTYASLLLSKGASLVYIKEQLGHSSIKTTIDIYGHLLPGSMKHVVDMLDPAVNTTQPK